jgi:hypothetical protein
MNQGLCTLQGIVSALDPLTRVLHIGGHKLWVPPEISLATVAIGATATASGHEEPSGRLVVTRLTLD